MASFPSRIYFAITNDCNLKCIHCYRSSSAPHVDELQTREVLSFLAYCSRTAKDGLLTVTLTGGEPFRRVDIWEILDYCHENEINIDVATNCLMMSGPTIKRLKLYPNINLQLSVDGATEATVNRLRGPGVFRRLVEVLELIDSERLNYAVDMNLVTVLTSINYREIRDIVEMARTYSISKVVFGECIPIGRAQAHTEHVLLKEAQLKYVVDTLSQLKRTEKQVVVVSQLYFDFLFDMEFSRANVCTAECGDVACIGPSGEVSLCPAFSEDRDAFVGNIRESSLLEIVASRRASDFRALAKQQRVNCEHWCHCKGGCHILAKKALGSAEECDPRCPLKST